MRWSAGYDPLITTLHLPDSNDRHVLAAAIHCKASIIVTFNRRDFPTSSLQPFGVVAQSPDDFACGLYDCDADAVLERVRRQRTALKNPAKSPQQFVESLTINRLPLFAERLRSRIDEL